MAVTTSISDREWRVRGVRAHHTGGHARGDGANRAAWAASGGRVRGCRGGGGRGRGDAGSAVGGMGSPAARWGLCGGGRQRGGGGAVVGQRAVLRGDVAAGGGVDV